MGFCRFGKKKNSLSLLEAAILLGHVGVVCPGLPQYLHVVCFLGFFLVTLLSPPDTGFLFRSSFAHVVCGGSCVTFVSFCFVWSAFGCSVRSLVSTLGFFFCGSDCFIISDKVSCRFFLLLVTAGDFDFPLCSGFPDSNKRHREGADVSRQSKFIHLCR